MNHAPEPRTGRISRPASVSIHTVCIYLLLAVSLSSCYINRTTIGNGPLGKNDPQEVFSKSMEGYLFWGAIPLNSATNSLPEHGDVQIKTSRDPMSYLLQFLTSGIYTTRTIEILVKPGASSEIAGMDISNGSKIKMPTTDGFAVGEVISYSTVSGKANIKYIDAYGQEQLKEKKFSVFTIIDEAEYNKAVSEHETFVEAHTFHIGEKVILKKGAEEYFGLISALDDKYHKATFEYFDVLHLTKEMKADYLQIDKISEEEFNTRMKAHELVEKNYQFTVGEKVKFSTSGASMKEGEIVILNETTKKATISYINSKNQPKTAEVGYLKVVKM